MIAATTPLPQFMPPAPSAAADQAALRTILPGRYSIVRTLGSGSSGVVVLAHDRVLQRWVAVKALLPDSRDDAERREQFHREALTSARLAHPNIVPVFDHGERDGVPYTVMRYVAGAPLAAHIAPAALLPVAVVCRVLAALADALDYAHRQQVVHRDIKPANIILERDTGQPMLTDFGIARAVSLNAMYAGEIQRERSMVRGTVHFMAPEQITGTGMVDGRCDLYALGALGYALLSGRLPIDGETFTEVARRQVSVTPPSLTTLAPAAPAAVRAAVMRCLAKRPDDRWPTGAALRAALLAALADAPPRESWTARARRALRRRS